MEFILLFIITLCVYGIAIAGEWVYDDLYIQPTFEPRHYLKSARIVTHSRFMALALFRWTYRLMEPRRVQEKIPRLIPPENSGENPFARPAVNPPYWTRRGMIAHHTVNMMLHAWTGFLFAQFLLHFWTMDRTLLAALIFTIHPLQAGSVAYLSGRSSILGLMFALMTWHLASMGNVLLLPAAVVSAVLGRYSKEDSPLFLMWLMIVERMFQL